jgi:hypothetical protein
LPAETLTESIFACKHINPSGHNTTQTETLSIVGALPVKAEEQSWPDLMSRNVVPRPASWCEERRLQERALVEECGERERVLPTFRGEREGRSKGMTFFELCCKRHVGPISIRVCHTTHWGCSPCTRVCIPRYKVLVFPLLEFLCIPGDCLRNSTTARVTRVIGF